MTPTPHPEYDRRCAVRYRICPLGIEEWKVQRRWFGFLWVDVFWNTGPDYYETLAFGSIYDARKWIASAIANASEHRARRIREAARASAIKPEKFP